MIQITILFVRTDSIYKTMAVECWDAERDATQYQGPGPIVAHPPCRAWGCLRKFARPRPGEKGLALWAVDKVRECGGVLEHPCGSRLWPEAGLPRPGKDGDQFGGFTLDVDQHWWGHRAQKRTWLYVCGCKRNEIPSMPIRITQAPCVITNMHGLRSGMTGYRKEVTKREREATPKEFAEWLIEVASRCSRKTEK